MRTGCMAGARPFAASAPRDAVREFKSAVLEDVVFDNKICYLQLNY